jgi:TolB-like protein
MARSSQRSATSAPPRPTEAEVRAHLDALLHSGSLAISDRNRRFLAYIVDETLAGRGDRIKAYNVALTAFDRTDDFDPQTDPIVRIEASRLRRALEHYYLTAGKADPLRIEIPKGSYVATFSHAALEPTVADSEMPAPPGTASQPIARRPFQPMRRPPMWWIASTAVMLLMVLAWLLPVLVDRAVGQAQTAGNNRTILILPFETGGTDGQAFVARGITAELIGRLQPRDTLSVLGQTPAASDPAANSDFILSGSAYTVGSKVYISAALAESETGRYLWSWNVERALTSSNLIGVEAAIAGEIADGIKPLMSAAAD